MTTAEMKARNMIARRSTAQLLDDWDATETAKHTAELAVVRGWLMDEFQRRDPEMFDSWIDDDDCSASPRKYFH